MFSRPRALTEQLIQAGRLFLLAIIYSLVPPTTLAEEKSKTAFSFALEIIPHAIQQLKNHLGVQSFNKVVSKNKRRRIDLLLKEEINAPGMIPTGSDDMWTMENVQAHFRAPSGLKIYMIILPCATSDNIIMRIMRQMFWCVHRSIISICAGNPMSERCEPRGGFVSCRADPRAYFNRGAGVQALHAGAAKAPFADEV